MTSKWNTTAVVVAVLVMLLMLLTAALFHSTPAVMFPVLAFGGVALFVNSYRAGFGQQPS